MDSTATLVIRIDTTTSELRAELARAEREVARTADSIGRELGRTAGVVGTLGASFKANLPALAAEAAVNIAAFAARTLDEASALRAAADASGIAIEQYQRLDYALKQAGLSQGQFGAALDSFLPNIAEAQQGGSKAAAAMERLGVSVKDAGGNAKSTDAVLLDVADGLAGIRSPAERAALASQLFGSRAGSEMAMALGKGSQAIRDLGKDAEILEEGMVRSADEINRRWDALTETISIGLKQGILEVIQGVVSAADRVNKSLEDSFRIRRAEALENALRSGDPDDIDAAFEDLKAHGEYQSEPPPEGFLSPKTREASMPADPPAIPPAVPATDPPAQSGAACGGDWDRQEAERAAAERKAAADALNAERAEAAARDDEARSRAHENAQAILRDKQALEDALNRELTLAQTAQETDTRTEEARRIENRLLEEQVKWREKGIPLTETELEQKRQIIAAIVEAQMATEAHAEAMEYLEQFGEQTFGKVGDALKSIFVEGADAAETFKNLASDVVSDLMEEFVKLAMVNPLKNAIFGKDPSRQTLGDLADGLLGGLFGDSGGSGGAGNNIVEGEWDWMQDVLSDADDWMQDVLSGADDWMQSIFDGVRETGGPVSRGKAYVVGEKRPELFVPSSPGVILPRIPALDTGNGGGGVSVQIVDQRQSGAKPEVTTSRGADGRQMVRVLVRDEVKGMVADGSFDKLMGGTYGVRRMGVTR